MTWKHFKLEEFACSCCHENRMNFDFITLLDHLREKLGIPFIIESGYRCNKHDDEFGGKRNHTTGLAADIRCTSSNHRHKMLAQFTKIFERVGIGKTFIHVDVVLGRPHEVIWLY